MILNYVSSSSISNFLHSLHNMVLKLLLCRSLWYFCLGLQCKSSRYDPLEGEDDFHDGDAKEDADGSAKL